MQKNVKRTYATTEEAEAGLIRPTPDPAIVANPVTSEEREAEAAIERAVTNLDQVRVEIANRKEERAAGRPPDTMVYVGNRGREEDIAIGVMFAPGHAGWEEITAAELQVTEARRKLIRLQDARSRRIRQWHIDHDNDLQPYQYQPTDTRFAVLDARRPAVPNPPERISLEEKVRDAARKTRELAERLSTWPTNHDLAGKVEDAREKETAARAELNKYDSKIVRGRIRELEAERASLGA